MDIGAPRRQYTIEPIRSPVPDARPAPDEERPPAAPASPLEKPRRP